MYIYIAARYMSKDGGERKRFVQGASTCRCVLCKYVNTCAEGGDMYTTDACRMYSFVYRL